MSLNRFGVGRREFATSTGTTISTTPTNSEAVTGKEERVVDPVGFIKASSPEEKKHNPFRYHADTSPLDRLLVALGAVTLLPLRLLLILPLPIVGALFSKLVLLGAKDSQRLHTPAPLSPFRQKLLRLVLRRLTRLFLFGLGFHKIKVKGRPASAEDAPILVANHLSFIDPLFFIARQLPSAIAKDAVAKLPLFGTIAKSMQVIFVDRKAKDSRKATLSEVKRRVTFTQENPGHRTFPQILIFPEGTTTNGSCLITFKTGAFVAGVPVQPAVIRYPHSHLFFGNRTPPAPLCAEPSQLSWVPFGPSGLKLLFRMLCNWSNRMVVEYLDVYRPSPEEQADPQLYANNVRNVMAKALGVPVTEHTYDDVLLLTRAFEFKLPESSINFNLESMKKQIDNLTLLEVTNLLERFNSIDLGHDGLLDPKEFAKALGVPMSEFSQKLFNLFDTDHSGAIDFKEFVVALAVLSRKVSNEDSIRLAFKAFDRNNDGTLTEEDIRTIIRTGWKTVSQSEVHDIFAAFDAKGDGRIDYEEFLNFLKRHPEYMNIFRDPNLPAEDSSSSPASQVQ